MGEAGSRRPEDHDPQPVEPFAQAYYRYSQELEQAWAPPEMQQQGMEAYGRFVEAQQDVEQPDYEERVRRAWLGYVQVVQKALSAPHIQAQAPGAYRSYLQAIQQAWQELDLTKVDPSTLSVINQSIAAAVWLAAAAAGYADNLSPPIANSV